MRFRSERVSYRKPFLKAQEECEDALRRARTGDGDVEARVHLALAELELLHEYIAIRNGFVRREDFWKLPRVDVPGDARFLVHELNHGPWRGYYAVARDGTLAVGLLFSKHPHDIAERWHEIELMRG